MQVMYPMSSSSGSYAGCCWLGEGITAVQDVINGLRRRWCSNCRTAVRSSDAIFVVDVALQVGCNFGGRLVTNLLSTIQRHLRSWQRLPSQSTRALRRQDGPSYRERRVSVERTRQGQKTRNLLTLSGAEFQTFAPEHAPRCRLDFHFLPISRPGYEERRSRSENPAS